MDAKVSDTMPHHPPGWRPERCDRIALVLQGGGALGAYQAGVYQALHEADVEPNWVSGVSIGAINSAIIAGNSRRNRIERLREFWHRITDRKIWSHTPDGDIFRKARNATSSMMTMLQGQPGFFKPRQPSAQAQRQACQHAGNRHPAADLSAESLCRRFQGLRILGHLNAGALG